MTTTIYAYGDSFIANRGPGLDGWATMLSKKTHLNLVNHGVSGGSTENAILKFTNDIKTGSIKPGDTVLFQLSTPGRLHLKFQHERPETASVYWHHVDPHDHRHTWYHQNKHHIEWYIRNFDDNLSVVNHNAYIHVVKNFAENNRDITVVLMQNTALPMEVEIRNRSENFVVVPLDLNVISKNEYKRPFEFHEWNKFTKYDVRVNHMSLPNLRTMSELVEQTITTRCADHFTYDRFQQKLFEVITSKEDHDRYVDMGLIYNMSHMFK